MWEDDVVFVAFYFIQKKSRIMPLDLCMKSTHFGQCIS
jgi:hypothetical protein